VIATVVDAGALAQVVWVSLVAATVLTVGFSVAVAAAARAGSERRAGRAGAATGWTFVTVACGAVCAVAVVLGVAVMLNK
jgi:hypothetical protein